MDEDTDLVFLAKLFIEDQEKADLSKQPFDLVETVNTGEIAKSSVIAQLSAALDELSRKLPDMTGEEILYVLQLLGNLAAAISSCFEANPKVPSIFALGEKLVTCAIAFWSALPSGAKTEKQQPLSKSDQCLLDTVFLLTRAKEPKKKLEGIVEVLPANLKSKLVFPEEPAPQAAAALAADPTVQIAVDANKLKTRLLVLTKGGQLKEEKVEPPKKEEQGISLQSFREQVLNSLSKETSWAEFLLSFSLHLLNKAAIQEALANIQKILSLFTSASLADQRLTEPLDKLLDGLLAHVSTGSEHTDKIFFALNDFLDLLSGETAVKLHWKVFFHLEAIIRKDLKPLGQGIIQSREGYSQMERLGKFLEETRIVHAAMLAEAQVEPNDQVMSFFDDLFQATSASFRSLLRPSLAGSLVATEKKPIPVADEEEDTFFGDMFYLSSDDIAASSPSQNDDKESWKLLIQSLRHLTDLLLGVSPGVLKSLKDSFGRNHVDVLVAVGIHLDDYKTSPLLGDAKMRYRTLLSELHTKNFLDETNLQHFQLGLGLDPSQLQWPLALSTEACLATFSLISQETPSQDLQPTKIWEAFLTSLSKSFEADSQPVVNLASKDLLYLVFYLMDPPSKEATITLASTVLETATRAFSAARKPLTLSLLANAAFLVRFLNHSLRFFDAMPQPLLRAIEQRFSLENLTRSVKTKVKIGSETTNKGDIFEEIFSTQHDIFSPTDTLDLPAQRTDFNFAAMKLAVKPLIQKVISSVFEILQNSGRAPLEGDLNVVFEYFFLSAWEFFAHMPSNMVEEISWQLLSQSEMVTDRRLVLLNQAIIDGKGFSLSAELSGTPKILKELFRLFSAIVDPSSHPMELSSLTFLCTTLLKSFLKGENSSADSRAYLLEVAPSLLQTFMDLLRKIASSFRHEFVRTLGLAPAYNSLISSMFEGGFSRDHLNATFLKLNTKANLNTVTSLELGLPYNAQSFYGTHVKIVSEQVSSRLRSRPLESLGQALLLTLQATATLCEYILSVPELLAKSQSLPLSLDPLVNMKKDVLFGCAWVEIDKVFASILKAPNENSSLVNLASLRGTHNFLAELSRSDKSISADPFLSLVSIALEIIKTGVSFGNVEIIKRLYSTAPWMVSMELSADLEKGVWARQLSIPASTEEQRPLNPCIMLMSLISRIPGPVVIADAVACLEALLKHKNDDMKTSFLQAFLQASEEVIGGFARALYSVKQGESSNGSKILNKLIKQLQTTAGIQGSRLPPSQLTHELQTVLQQISNESDADKTMTLALELSALVGVEAALRDNLSGLEEESSEPEKVESEERAGSAPFKEKARQGYERILQALLGVLPEAFLGDPLTLKTAVTSLSLYMGDLDSEKKILGVMEAVLMKFSQTLEADETTITRAGLESTEILLSFLVNVASLGSARQYHTASMENTALQAIRALNNSQTPRIELLANMAVRQKEIETFKADDETHPLEEKGHVEYFHRGELDETALANKCCTFTETGKDFRDQHWYFCYTCGFTTSEGCCSVCVQTCHKGHEVSYAKYSRFFCDCGNRPVCKALKPREMTPKAIPENKVPKEHEASSSSAASIKSREPTTEATTPALSASASAIPATSVHFHHLQSVLSPLIVRITGQLLKKITPLLESVSTPTAAHNVASRTPNSAVRKTFAPSTEPLSESLFWASTDSESPKSKFKGEDGKVIRKLLQSQQVVRNLMSVSSKYVLAALDSSVIGVVERAPRSGAQDPKLLTTITVPFELISVSANRVNPRYVCAAGLKNATVFIIEGEGEQMVSNEQIALPSSLTEDGHLVKAVWVPHSQVHLALVSDSFVKIFNLSKDVISPQYYFVLDVSSGSIIDFTFAHRSKGRDESMDSFLPSMVFIVTTSTGQLFAQSLEVGDSLGAVPLLSQLEGARAEIFDNHSGISVSFLERDNALFYSFGNGDCYIGSLSADFMAITEVFSLTEVNPTTTTQEAKLVRFKKSTPLWSLIPIPNPTRDLVASLSPKSGQLVVLEFKENGLVSVQMMKDENGGRIEGLDSIDNETFFWTDTGHLSRLVAVPESSLDQSKSPLALFTKELLSKEYSTGMKQPKSTKQKAVFPVTFFENCDVVTHEVTLSSPDFSYNSDVAKQKLASQNEFVASSKMDSLTLNISLAKANQYFAGIRVLVGNGSLATIPTELKVLGRTIKTRSDAKRWYDIPFTTEEMAKTQSQMKLVASASHSKSSKPAIDSIEVYSCSSDIVQRELEIKSIALMKEKEKYEVPLSELLVGRESPSTRKFQFRDFSVAEKSLSSLLDFLIVHQNDKSFLLDASIAELRENVFALLRPQVCLQYLPEVVTRMKTLFSTFSKPEQLYEAFDPVELSSEGTIVSMTYISIEDLHYHVSLLQQVAHFRFSTLSSFFNRNPAFIESLGQKFVTFLDGRSLPEAYNLEGLFTSFLSVVIAYGCFLMRAGKPRAPIHQILKQLLFHPKLRVGSLTSQALIGLSQLDVSGVRELLTASRPLGSHGSLGLGPSDDPNELKNSEYPEIFADFEDPLLALLPVAFSKGGTSSLPYFQFLFSYAASRSTDSAGSRVQFVDKLVATVLEKDVLSCLKPDANVQKSSAQLECETLLLSTIFLLMRPGTKGASGESEKQVISIAPSQAVVDFALHKFSGTVAIGALFTLAKKLYSVVQAMTLKASEGDAGEVKLRSERIDERLETFPPFLTSGYLSNLQNPDDIFSHCHHLLAEAVLRLSTLLWWKCAPEQLQHESVSSWMDLACQYTSLRLDFSEVCGRNLLYAVSKDHDVCLKAVDQYEFLASLGAARETYGKIVRNKGLFNYEDATHLSSHLNRLYDIALKRPSNWMKFCLEHQETCLFLFDCLNQGGSQRGMTSLRLLRLALSAKQDLRFPSLKLSSGVPLTKGSKNIDGALLTAAKEDAKETSQEKLNGHPLEPLVTREMIVHFMKTFSFDRQNKPLRIEAVEFLYWLWRILPWAKRNEVFHGIISVFPSTPVYGSATSEMVNLMAYIAHRVSLGDPDNSGQAETRSTFISALHETFLQQNRAILNHPNSYLYEALGNFVEIGGYYLESDPCLSCNFPEVPFAETSLDNLKAEVKYTDCAIMARFSQRNTLQGVHMSISDLRPARMVRSIDFFYNNKTVTDITELKNKFSMWKKIGTKILKKSQSDLVFGFDFPIDATNFMIEFTSFYENVSAAEKLVCPRCNRVVTDRHGICNNCHENARQCRHCRHINYENLQAYLCIDCGYCSDAKFTFNFLAKPGYSVDVIENESDEKKCMALIEKESKLARTCVQQLHALKRPLERALSGVIDKRDRDPSTDGVSQASTEQANKKISSLSTIYNSECHNLSETLTRCIRTLSAARKELLRYNNEIRGMGKLDPQVHTKISGKRAGYLCYGCVEAFTNLCILLIGESCRDPANKDLLTKLGVVEEIVNFNLRRGGQTGMDTSISVLCSLVADNKNATHQVHQLVKRKLDFFQDSYLSVDVSSVIGPEVNLLTKLCLIEDILWEERLKTVFELFFRSIDKGSSNPIVLDKIILPALSVITQLCIPESESKKDAGSNVGYIPHEEKAPEVSYKEWVSQPSGPIFNEWKGKMEALTSPKELSQRALRLARKYAQKWKKGTRSLVQNQKTKPASTPFAKFTEGNWVTQLLLNPISQPVRLCTAKLIRALSASSATSRIHFLHLLHQTLPRTSLIGEQSSELFSLFHQLIDPIDYKMHLVSRGFFKELCALITEEVSFTTSLDAADVYAETDLSQGFVLKEFVKILINIMSVPLLRARFKKQKLVGVVLENYLALRSLVSQKSKLTEDCSGLLLDLVQQLTSDSEEDKNSLLEACVQSLAKFVDTRDTRTPMFVFERLCNTIRPPAPEVEVYLHLEKIDTQEEFIRGTMTKNPYLANDIGLLMRDVKNKICSDLELYGLLEDDNGMELLVCDKIIALDLNIKDVYEQVWKRENMGDSTSPMVVIFRLQGLDGEATEERVDHLSDGEKEEGEPEVVYKSTLIIGQSGGLPLCLRYLEKADLNAEKELVLLILKLLSFCCKIRENRKLLWETNAISPLLEKLKGAFAVESSSDDVSQTLLSIIESIVDEANVGSEASASEKDSVGNSTHLSMILEKLDQPVFHQPKHKKAAKAMMRILPFLTYGAENTSKLLIDFFKPHFDLEKYKEGENFYLEGFVEVAESIKQDRNGQKLRDFMVESGVIDIFFDFILRHGPPPPEPEATPGQGDAWKAAFVGHPAASNLLRILTGLAKGNERLRRRALGKPGIVGILHEIELVTSEKHIGPLSETLLDVLSEGKDEVAALIEKHRNDTKEKKRQLALQQREKMLKSMGFVVASPEQGGKITTSSKVTGMEELDDEGGFVCVVCREGYKFKPTEVLGIYTYSKKIDVSIGGVPTKQERCFSTVTHFNLIHYKCHNQATRADKSGKHTREEWEGATLRNSDTKCNNLFPIQGPETPENNYHDNVEYYFTRLNDIWANSVPRTRILVHDLRSLYLKLAFEESFSVDTHGGGRESNVKLIPFMLQMGLNLLTLNPSGVYEASLNTYLEAKEDAWYPAQLEPEDTCFTMISALLLRTPRQWDQVKGIFFRRLILLAHKRFLASGKENEFNLSTKPAEFFKACRPLLLFYFLIAETFTILASLIPKAETSPEAPPADAKGKGKVDDSYVASLRKELVTNSHHILPKFGKVLSAFEDEMLPLETFQEFFDVLGYLDLALSGHATCEEYIGDLIAKHVK